MQGVIERDVMNAAVLHPISQSGHDLVIGKCDFVDGGAIGRGRRLSAFLVVVLRSRGPSLGPRVIVLRRGRRLLIDHYDRRLRHGRSIRIHRLAVARVIVTGVVVAGVVGIGSPTVAEPVRGSVVVWPADKAEAPHPRPYQPGR